MALNFITPASLTISGTGSYVDVDVSASVPAGAIGALLRVYNTSLSSSLSYGLRKNGSTDDLYGDIGFGAQLWELVALDSSRVFEVKRESTALTFELTGWVDSRANLFASAVKLSLSSINTHETVDLSTWLPSGAVAAILLFGFNASAVHARPGGATYSYPAAKPGRMPFIVGVDGSRQVEIYRGSSLDNVYLLGYIAEGLTVENPPTSALPATTATWENHSLPAGATGAIFWSRSYYSNGIYGVRKDGTSLEWNKRVSIFSGYAVCEAASEIVETYVDPLGPPGVGIYRLGYFTAAGDDHVVQPISIVSAPEFSAPSITAGDAHTVSPVSIVSAPEFTAPSISVAIDQRPEQILLIAYPFDSSVSTTLNGPPVPAGEGVPDDTEFTAEGSEVGVYWGDGRGVSFVSQATDDPADEPFAPRLQSAYQLQVEAFSGALAGGARPSGAATESTGAIEVLNTDGGVDDVLDYAWDGRSVELYRVRSGAALADARLCLRGTVERLTWSESKIILALRDRHALFQRPLITSTYGGTGGLDGDVNVTGVLKPQGYGPVINAEGVLINSALLIWQLHDRQIFAVDDVRDKGVSLTFAADYADYDALAAATVGAQGSGADIEAGEYATCLAEGLIRLGSSPAGRVTCDFKGDAVGGYVDTAADILRRIVTSRLVGGNIADPDGLDTDSFDDLNAAQPAALQFYTAGQNPTVADVLAQIMTTVGGWYGFTREGLLYVKRLEAPASPTFTLDRSNISSADRLSAVREPPSWRERVEWGRPWVIQTGDDLAGSVTAEDRDRWSRLHYAQWSDSSIRGAHRLARTVETPSLFAFESDAQAEADRLGALWGVERDVISVRPAGQNFLRWVGDVGTIDLKDADGNARYGLPKDATIIALYENARNGEVRLVMVG
jgi:hypothetical protein